MMDITRREAMRLASIGSAASLIALGCGRSSVVGPGKDKEPDTENKKPPFLVLSCDGGGIRGLLTARVVQKLQQEMGLAKDPSGQPWDFLGRTNCFAGASVGGIIALCLACKLAPDKLVDICRNRRTEIFSEFKFNPSGIIESGESQLIELFKRPIKAIEKFTAEGLADKSDNLFFVRYNSDGLRKVLNEEVDADKQTLGSLGKNKSVLVTTMQLGQRNEGWRPVILHNLPTNDTEDGDGPIGKKTTVLDAALCTSAAPIYFSPHKHPELGFCADGGIFANNPGMATLVKAKQAGYDNLRILSIGTGSTFNRMKVPPFYYFKDEQCTRCGLLAWLLPVATKDTPAFPLLACLLDAGAAADAHYCESLLGAKHYRRIQVRLEKDVPLDAYQEEHVDYLDKQAEKYFQGKQWAEDKQWIIENYLR